ncbi:MAG: LacI family DNA-binding transcriptional regulator [Bellilinea sp.]
MTTTIKDIAKRTGVSHSTVSRALRGDPLISFATAKRIRQAAKDMAYLPSAAARSLKTNRSQVLGVIASSIDDPFFSEIVFGIEEAAQEAGYRLFIGASQHDPAREQKIVQAMMEHRTDGVIICSSSFSPDQGRQLLEYGFPIVVVNHQGAENFHYSIFHDDLDGSRQITRHLIELGHRRIAYLGNSLSGRTTLDRLAGFKTEMQAADLTIPNAYIHHVAGNGPQFGLDGIEQLLTLNQPPTAIVCFNDMLAMGVLKGCHMAGLIVPDDISVTGFDNITFSAYTHPPLTTFDQPKQSIGTEAARLLLDLLDTNPNGSVFQPKEIVLKGKLLVRNSTAAPPTAPKTH